MGYLLLLVVMGGGLLLAVLQLPGLWLMLAAAGVYAWATAGAFIGVKTMVLLLAIVVVAEVVETLATALGARRAGASKTAMLLSMVGAVVGGIALTLIPVPVLGTLTGVCLGAFGGAMAGELLRGRNAEQSVKSGLGAVIGRLLGTAAKLTLGFAIFIIVAAIGWPGAGSVAGGAVAPGVATPATVPVER